MEPASTEAVDLARKVVAALNQGDPDAFAACFTVDATVSFMASGRQIHGRAGIRGWLADAITKISSLRNEIVALHGDDLVALLEVRASGLPTVGFPGAAPGRSWEKAEAYVYELEGGLIARARCYT